MIRILPLIWLGIAIIWQPLAAQELEVSGFTVKGDVVDIRYTLKNTPKSKPYFVQVFALRGRDTLSLREVTGAVGDSIREGSHLITWNARREWGRFRGKITFLVTATPYFTFARPAADTTIRRGQPFPVAWYGANHKKYELNIELYRYGALMDTLGKVTQSSGFNWLVPDQIIPGSGYRLRVTGPLGSGIDQFSPLFSIQRKTNPMVYVAPAAVLAGGVLWLVLRKPLPVSPTQPE